MSFCCTVNPTIVFTSHLAAHMNKIITHFYLLHTEKGSLTPKAAFFLFVLCSFLSHSFMHTHFVLLLPCFTLYSCFARFQMAAYSVIFTAWLFRLKASSNRVLSPRSWWISSLSPALNCRKRGTATTEKGCSLISDKCCMSYASFISNNWVFLYKRLLV